MTDSACHEAELDRQLAVLVDRGYPALAGLSVESFAELVEPLRARLAEVPPVDGDRLPFLLVVRGSLVPTNAAVERFEVGGVTGWTDMADEIDRYQPIEGVGLPAGDAYLVTDVSTGPETLGTAPRDALPVLLAAGRTPLTVDEGVALLTQHADVLTGRNAFQALGSRAGHKRVPSFWMSKGAPRLGWCWEGNPHSWLGAASAGRRLGAAL